MGMVRPEVRLAYRRGSTGSRRMDPGAISKPASEADRKSKEVEKRDLTSWPANLTPNREEDDIANPTDRTS